MGRIKVPQRKLSFLPEPPTITEDQARYIRLPAREEEEKRREEEARRIPRVTYEDQITSNDGKTFSNVQHQQQLHRETFQVSRDAVGR